MMKIKIAILFVISFYIVHAQKITVQINDGENVKAYLYTLSGEKTILVDSSVSSKNGEYTFNLERHFSPGIYRINFSGNNFIDFVNDGEDVALSTNKANLLDSLKVVSSKSNELFYAFIKLNKQYKLKTELLQLILARFPKDDPYYSGTKKRLQELQNEYVEFVNIKAQEYPTSFIAKYIRSSQLPLLDSEIPTEKQLDYLKVHALDYVDFNDASLMNSDVFTNKSIEYLTYFRNPQLSKELLEKEFMKAIDTLLNKAKVNQLVYQHITEYLIDGFKKFGFDEVIDYIVENYVIKDDLCLDSKIEGMIQRRINQARLLKIGSVVPNIILPDINGNEVNLEKINKEKVLLVFYASWCPHCKELLPKLNEFYKSQKDKKFEILAISLDNKKEDWINFVNNNCPSLINLSDLKGWDGKTVDDFFIYATPTMFIINQERKIICKPLNIEDIKNVITK